MPDSSCAPQGASTPALVLGCFRQGGIGIVRSLGRLGVPVYAVDAHRFAPAFFSKYCQGSFRWNINTSSSGESLQFLLEVGNKIGRRSVLIPTSDIGAMFVAAQADQLAERFLFPDQTDSLIRSLCSKKSMHEIAKSCNIPTPETSFPASKDDVLNYLSTARFPIMVKPIYNNLPGSGTRPWHMFLAHTERELLDRYEAIENPLNPNVILQEYIPGPDSSTWTFNGYFDRESRCLAGFTGRKLRNYPAYFGQASLAICERNDEVEKTAVEFMQRIGYRGALDIGFRYDRRDGRYKVNDVNPRVGAMLRVFVGDNGIDIVRALYLDLTNQPVISSWPKEGRKWIVEDVDWISAIRYWRDGNLTLREWFRSISGISETTFLARDDPMPFAAACIQDTKRAMSAGFDFVKKKLRRTDASVAACSARSPSQAEIK
jgi:D-aspartate ligase